MPSRVEFPEEQLREHNQFEDWELDINVQELMVLAAQRETGELQVRTCLRSGVTEQNSFL